MNIIRVSSRETSGPSGAGDRAGSGRNPRLDGRVQLAVPPNWRIERPTTSPLPLRLRQGDGQVTLTEYDVEQGTEEWLEARRGIVTASVIGQLITPSTLKPAHNPISRSIVAELAAERLTGFTDDHYVSDDMFRGHQDEPRAIEAYEKHCGVQVRSAGFLVNDDHGFRLGYSPDGLVGDDGLVECKSRRPKKHLATVLADEVPAENMAQLQTGLLVTGRDWIDYVSFCGGMHLWVKRVTPDERWFRAIVAAATEFEMTYGVMRAKYEAHTLGLPLTERIVEQEITF